jgi:hypothetical protein
MLTVAGAPRTLAGLAILSTSTKPGGAVAMTKNLEMLIEAARKVQPSPDQEEEQRRSFAYGNTAFENSLITREMVDKQAEAIDRERGTRHRA